MLTAATVRTKPGDTRRGLAPNVSMRIARPFKKRWTPIFGQVRGVSKVESDGCHVHNCERGTHPA